MNPRKLVTCCAIAIALAWPCVLRADEPDFSAELPRIPPSEPAEALAQFTIAPGFRVELAAAEPLVSSPVAIAWDERGRMYVVEMCGYSEHRDERISRIRLLTDMNADGKYDESTIFAGGLFWPTAVGCWNGGVFVADAPDILYLKDTNGDGVADVKQQVFSGFGIDNVQGLLNTFLWHFDNRIHGSASSNGGQIVSANQPQNMAISVRGRDFSFDPRSLDLRAESGGAQHGMSFDDWGRKFVCSNSDHAQQVMFEDRYVARNPLQATPGARISIAADGPQAEVYRISPVEPWRILRTQLRVQGIVPGLIEGGGRAAGYFTGATGVTILRGDAFPESMRSLLIVGDVGGNLVHRKRLRQSGLQYVAERIDDKSEFLASTDCWFRPAQFANGPDGALYVVDMCREVIEHPHSLPPQIKRHLDLDSGRDRGRIWRIVPDGFVRPTLPDLLNASPQQLVELLAHPNAWHRETASRLLYEHQNPDSVPPLVKLVSDEKASAISRVHALYALNGLGQLNEGTLATVFVSNDPRLREHAVRVSERLLNGSQVLRQKLRNLATDEDLGVRYQLAFTLGYFPKDEKVSALTALLSSDCADPWIRLACLSSVHDCAADVLEALLAQPSVRKDPHALIVFGSLASEVGLAGHANDLKSILLRLTDITDEDFSVSSAILVAIHSCTQSVKSLPEDVTSLAAQLNKRVIAAARVVILDDKLDPVSRSAPMKAMSLGEFDDVSDLLSSLLEPQQPTELQQAALLNLRERTDSGVATIVINAWNSLTPATRRLAFDVLTGRPQPMAALLTALEQGEIRPEELDVSQRELLRQCPDLQLRQRAQKLFASTPDRNREQIVAGYRPALSLAGDAKRGKTLFKKNCSACHRLENEGNEVGPNLAALRNRGNESLLIGMLDPNREVNPQFLSYILLTNTGRSFTGIIESETATSVTLKRGDNAKDTVLRSDIEVLRSTGLSLMPEGLERELDQQAVADLLAYLPTVK